jgi:hypothetical protein
MVPYSHAWGRALQGTSAMKTHIPCNSCSILKRAHKYCNSFGRQVNRSRDSELLAAVAGDRLLERLPCRLHAHTFLGTEIIKDAPPSSCAKRSTDKLQAPGQGNKSEGLGHSCRIRTATNCLHPRLYDVFSGSQSRPL